MVLDIKFDAFRIAKFFFWNCTKTGQIEGGVGITKKKIWGYQKEQMVLTVPIWNVDRNRANLDKECMPAHVSRVGYIITTV